jgi:hypothetical protein
VSDVSEVDERLLRLAVKTEGIEPSAGFAARVMNSIVPESVAWFSSLGTAARVFLPVAVVVAAMALFWAYQTDVAVEAELAASYGSVEVDW